MKTKKVFVACALNVCVATAYSQNDVARSCEGVFNAMQNELASCEKEIESRLGSNSFFLEFTASRTCSSVVFACDNEIMCEEKSPSNSCKATITLTGDNVVKENAAQVSNHYDFKDGDNWTSLRQGLRFSAKQSLKSVLIEADNKRRISSEARFVYLPPITRIEESAFATPVPVEVMKGVCESAMSNISKYSTLYDDTLSIAMHQTDLYRLTTEGQKTRSAECYYIVNFVVHGKNSDKKDTRFLFSKVYGKDQVSKYFSEVEADLLAFANATTAACQAKKVKKEISYEGPVLFEGNSAWGAMFKDREWYNQIYSNVASNKYPIGKSICHPCVSVSQQNNAGSALRHIVDADGTCVQDVLLVSNGVLASKIGGRIVYDAGLSSTGNYIFSPLILTPATRYSSLHAFSLKTEPAMKIRQDLIEEAKAKGLSCAYIVRDLYGLSEIVEIDTATGKETVLNADAHVHDVQMSEYDEFSIEKYTKMSVEGGNPSTIVCPQSVLLKNVKIKIDKPFTFENLGYMVKSNR